VLNSVEKIEINLEIEMKILVTGSTGTNGRKLVKLLVKGGATVVAAVRDPAKGQDLKDAGAHLVVMDWTKPETVEAAFHGIDRVFILTPMVFNIADDVRLAVKAAKTHGVKFLLKFSSAGADPTSSVHLAREHGLAENAIKESGIHWAILQPNFFHDNWINFQGQAVKSGVVYGSAGDGKTSYIAVDDICAVAAKILLHPEHHYGKSYLLTGNQALSSNEVVSIIGKHIGKEVKYVDVGDENLKKTLLGYGLPEWMADDFVYLEVVKRNNWSALTSPVVKELLGKDPISFDEWAKAHADGWK